MAVRPGFEPGQRPPKGLVLPLHHRTSRQKIASFTFTAKQILCDHRPSTRSADIPVGHGHRGARSRRDDDDDELVNSVLREKILEIRLREIAREAFFAE